MFMPLVYLLLRFGNRRTIVRVEAIAWPGCMSLLQGLVPAVFVGSEGP
jgi:hypothetical protein